VGRLLLQLACELGYKALREVLFELLKVCSGEGTRKGRDSALHWTGLHLCLPYWDQARSIATPDGLAHC